MGVILWKCKLKQIPLCIFGCSCRSWSYFKRYNMINLIGLVFGFAFGTSVHIVILCRILESKIQACMYVKLFLHVWQNSMMNLWVLCIASNNSSNLLLYSLKLQPTLPTDPSLAITQNKTIYNFGDNMKWIACHLCFNLDCISHLTNMLEMPTSTDYS